MGNEIFSRKVAKAQRKIDLCAFAQELVEEVTHVGERDVD